MSKITPFEFEQLPVRVITIDGEPWFVAADLLSILSLDRKALERLDPEEKGVSSIHTLGGEQEMTTINESGLYSLVLGSRKPEAKRFKKWVTSEVLPTIRKTGSYSVKRRKPAPTLLQQSTEAARAFKPLMSVAMLVGCDRNAAAISANQAILKLTNLNLLEALGQTHIEAERQVGHWYNPTELGREIGRNAREINLMMAEAGLQERLGDRWEPTDAGREFCRIFDTGKKQGSGVPIVQVKWSNNVIPILANRKSA